MIYINSALSKTNSLLPFLLVLLTLLFFEFRINYAFPITSFNRLDFNLYNCIISFHAVNKSSFRIN